MSRKSYSIGMAGSLAAAAFIVAVPSAQALSFKISGQVNQAIIGANNGQSTSAGFVTDNASPTLFGFSGSEKINPNLSVGFDYVEELSSNTSNHFDVNQTSSSGSAVKDRIGNVYFKGPYGTLKLGKLNGAANSASKVDLSGTGDLGGGSTIDDYMGNVHFLGGHTVNGNYDSVAIGKTYSNFDALSRVDGIRYNSPRYKGLMFALSVDTGRAVEFSPKFKRTFANGVKLAAAVDYVNTENREKNLNNYGGHKSGINNNEQFQEYGGSASMLLPNGLNFTVQYKRRTYSNTYYASYFNDHHSMSLQSYSYKSQYKHQHSQTYFGGIGYTHGKNHVQAMFGQTDSLYNSHSKVRNYGLAYVYDLKKSINLYAAYHNLSGNHLNLKGGSSQDVNVVFTGVRVKFF